MNSNNKNQVQLHKMELDEKYLSQKLLEISKNSPIILSNLRKFKSKCKTKYKYRILTHEKHVINLLKICQRTLRLLLEEEYIRHTELFGISIYVLSDIYNFLRTNNKYQKRKSS